MGVLDPTHWSALAVLAGVTLIALLAACQGGQPTSVPVVQSTPTAWPTHTTQPTPSVMAPEYGSPTPLMEGTFISISSGLNHVCGLRADGSVACEGSGEYSQDWPVDTLLNGQSLVAEAISSGYEHTCAVFDDYIACDPLAPERDVPVDDVVLASLSGGAGYTCGLRVDGSPLCWWIGGGEPVWPEDKFTAISSGGLQACGLRNDQSVICWQYFDLPPADPGYFIVEILNDYSVTPYEGQNFSSISAGYAYVCGLRTDGSPFCWWPVDVERLWDRSRSYEQIFDDRGQTEAPEGDLFAAISSGGLHACGLRTDGSVACWGSNDRGQVAPPKGTFIAISSGYDFTCGLREDGTVACWGSIHFG